MNNQVDEIRARVPISTLLGSNSKRIPCPLPGHDDRHPSCDVDHHSNLFHCKACDVGGDVFTLLMLRDRYSFKDALKELAGIAGVPLAPKTEESQKAWEREQRIQKARAYAVRYYHENLLDHQGGLKNLELRGISLETIKRMQLGWSDGNLVKSIKRANLDGLSVDDFVAAGLIADNGRGGHHDWFDVRIIFPMITNGIVQNISGRKTDVSTSEEKYRHLKGFPMTGFYNEGAIGETVFLFEGHPDTLSGVQIGLPAVGVVGTSGMTQPEKLARCQDIFICPDNDAPGRKAAEKWAREIMRVNPQARICFLPLPEGVKDFNDWMISIPPIGIKNAFEELQAGAQDVIQYKIDQLETSDDLHELWPYLDNMNELRRDHCFKVIKAKMPSFGLSTLRRSFKEWKNQTLLNAATKNPQIAQIEYNSDDLQTLNIGYEFTADKAGAHVCIYGKVKRVDEQGVEANHIEPILIQSLIDIASGTCRVNEVSVVDNPHLGDLKTIPTRSVVRSRWSQGSIRQLVGTSPAEVNTGELARDIADFFKTYIWFKDTSNYYVLAFYIMGTYSARLFGSFPYLAINGIKRSGKSNTLELLKLLCFNSLNSVNSSISSTFRTIEACFSTWIRDEAEQFNTKTPENADELTILNSGYKAGSVVMRTEKNSNGQMEVQEFNVFSPKVFGGIRIVNNVLLDRSILLKSHRAPGEIVKQMPRMNQTRNQWERQAAALRDKLYTWTLTKFHHVKGIFDNYPASDEIINREWELWLPLLSMAYLADMELKQVDPSATPDFLSVITQAASSKSKEKHELEQEDNIEILILETIIQALEDSEVCPFHPGENWYCIQDLAKCVTESLQKEGVYKSAWTVSSRKLTRILEQTQVISNRDSQIKVMKNGFKTYKCVELTKETLRQALAQL